MRYPKKTWRNLAVLIFVLPVRVAVLLPLLALAAIGEFAASAAEVCCDWIPGLDAEPAAQQATKEQA
jgi:hypothetical protein